MAGSNAPTAPTEERGQQTGRSGPPVSQLKNIRWHAHQPHRLDDGAVHLGQTVIHVALPQVRELQTHRRSKTGRVQFHRASKCSFLNRIHHVQLFACQTLKVCRGFRRPDLGGQRLQRVDTEFGGLLDQDLQPGPLRNTSAEFSAQCTDQVLALEKIILTFIGAKHKVTKGVLSDFCGRSSVSTVRPATPPSRCRPLCSASHSSKTDTVMENRL